jgi:hypothetical protein
VLTRLLVSAALSRRRTQCGEQHAIVRLHLNSDVSGRGLCVYTNPNLPNSPPLEGLVRLDKVDPAE